MATRLAARQVEISYNVDASPVLTQFTLEICPGELVGVIGPNGSGKSTLVRALSRALRPAAGVVLLGDSDLYDDLSARESAQAIAVVPQETAISLDFTVREIVRMGRAPHLPRRPFAGESVRDARIAEEAMRAAGVLSLAERGVTTLSGGERQRVLVARALAQQSDVLLLDEPTAHLDLRHQTEMLHLARNLAHGEGKAVLAALHDLNLAAAYCDQLVLLKGGRLVAQGTPAEVLTADRLESVYGARVWVRRHPLTGRPDVLSLPLPPDTGDSHPCRHIHVICGGGTGASLLSALRYAGYFVTVGGLNEGDTDAEAAEMLDIKFAREAAFSSLSSSALTEAARLAESADMVVLTEVAFGIVNLANLQAALELRRAGKPVLCVQRPETNFAVRDLVGGAAGGLWDELRALGAVIVPDNEAVLRHLESGKNGSDC